VAGALPAAFDYFSHQCRRNRLKDQDQNPQGGSILNTESNETQTAMPSSKRRFVEPEISQPVDVLEATTFFQSVDSGATN
jgi:hypothetical protein